MTYKDHKKESRKTRPVVTGCTSNTRGLSNSVSNFLESIANSVQNPLEEHLIRRYVVQDQET